MVFARLKEPIREDWFRAQLQREDTESEAVVAAVMVVEAAAAAAPAVVY